MTADVEVLATSDVSAPVLERVRRMCDLAWGGDFSDDDWDHTLGGTHVIVRDAGTVVAHAAVVARTMWFDDRQLEVGYVEGVVTDPDRRRRGFGRAAMQGAADVIRSTYPVGLLATGVHGFYERLGWERWRGPTFVRTPTGLVRTLDEDDGIMVLRFGPSADLDVTASLTCEERAGDDW